MKSSLTPNDIVTQMKTYELERRIQQMEEECAELHRLYDALQEIVLDLQGHRRAKAS